PHTYSSFSLLLPRPPPSTLFPYTTLFRSGEEACEREVLQPGEVRPELDHPSDRFPVAAEGHGVEPLSLRLEDSRRDLAGCLEGQDRKSTRLNSSHVSISYAVFCLKKKKNM